MTQRDLESIIRAQSLLMGLHDITSEAALNVLVWAATDRAVTVLEVARTICDVDTSGQLDAHRTTLAPTA